MILVRLILVPFVWCGLLCGWESVGEVGFVWLGCVVVGIVLVGCVVPGVGVAGVRVVPDGVRWGGVFPAEWGGPVAGAVGVAGVAEPAAVLGAVVVFAFHVQGEVVGGAAGGLAGSVGHDCRFRSGRRVAGSRVRGRCRRGR